MTRYVPSGERVRRVMIGNRSRDTKPELALRRAVHAAGLRYRVAARPLQDVRRTADLLFSRERLAVFLDGCFWHGCPLHYVAAKSNIEYWDSKIASNIQRDRDTDARLRSAGWTVIRVWAHEQPGEAAQSIKRTVLLLRARAAQ